MGVLIRNVIGGVLSKLSSKKAKTSFASISWMKEKILKHLDEETLKVIEVGDLKIKYQRPYELLHTYKELFEDEIYRFNTSTETPLIIDCGANIGLSVLYFKSLYPTSKVIAFEPDEANYKLLQENCKLNSLTNVECRKTAVWKTNEELSFSSAGTQGSQIARSSDKHTVKVKAERLADFLQNTQIDFLKIDIEGAELEVVKDCLPYLKNVKNLFVEYHGKTQDSSKLSELIDILKSEFDIYLKLAADSIEHPFVQKNTDNAFDVQLNIFCFRS